MAAAEDSTAVAAPNGVEVKQTTTSSTTTTSNGSPESSSGSDDSNPATATNNLDTKHKYAENLKQPGRSMADRSKVPISFYISVVSVIGLQLFSGLLDSTSHSVRSLQESLQVAISYMQRLIVHMHYLTKAALTPVVAENDEERPALEQYMVAIVATTAIGWVTYVLILAPLMAGFWTGRKATKHVFHRYMGLLYLIQYPLAWLEFAQGHPSTSILPHLVALNGIIQAWSAFFTFKVLPELNDAGYYSDKSVLSRSFVHENAFFQMMCLFGSIYYHDECRAALRSRWPGRVLEYVYVFWPYILVRPFFPTTRFKDAGQTHKGRSTTYQTFYEYGTYAVKIFFLYAKYFLGFYFNFLIFLDLPTAADWKLLRGCLLLNIGTVSIAIFLHTLRFKKIFPGVLTFSIYLAQIYATILGIPFCYHIFSSHPKLMSVCLAGLLCNMTRNRKIHAAWCFVTMGLLSYEGIEW